MISSNCFDVPVHAADDARPPFVDSSTPQDFVVSSVISCVTSSLRTAFFSRHTHIMRVLLDDSQSSTHKIDTILSKFQAYTCLSLDSTDSSLAAACNDGTITIYDVNAQVVLKELSGHGDGRCTAFQFSPNLVDAVSSSDKGQLLVSALVPNQYQLCFHFLT
jgi:WD40 repeat protein